MAETAAKQVHVGMTVSAAEEILRRTAWCHLKYQGEGGSIQLFFFGSRRVDQIGAIYMGSHAAHGQEVVTYIDALDREEATAYAELLDPPRGPRPAQACQMAPASDARSTPTTAPPVSGR